MLLLLSDTDFYSTVQCITIYHIGDIDDAAEKYERCLVIDVNHHKARLNLATLHHKYGALKEAFIHYEVLMGHWKASTEG